MHRLRQWLQNDRPELWSLRLYYFALFAAAGTQLPFITLFYRHRGLSGTQIGLLGTVSGALAMATAPLWGRWADRLARPQRLMRWVLLGVALSYLVLSQQREFAWIVLVVAIGNLIGAGVLPMSDSMAIAAAQRANSGFGSVRLWGSVGWVAVVPITGWLIEHYGFLPAFIIGAAALTVGAFVLGRSNVEQAILEATAEAPTGIRQAIRQVGRDRAMVGLAIALVVTGIGASGRFQFEPIFLDQLGASKTLIGLSVTVPALIEVLVMGWADRWVRRYGSHRVLMGYALLDVASTSLVLAWPTIPSVLVARALHGISFSMLSVSLMAFISERTPDNRLNTMVALYTATLRYLFMLVGSLVAGLVFDAFGAYWVYVVATGGYVLGWVVLRLTVTGRRSRVEAP